VYDRYGNRWDQLYNGACTAGSTFCATFDGNNHNSNGLLVYDAAGNVTQDNMHHYGYDGENRLVSVDSGTTAAYVYDAEGKRVRKTTGGLSVDYVYDLAGAATTEFNATGGWNRGEVYAGGRHVATYASNTTYFDLGDWVGTERVRTTAAGVKCETVTSLAFGDGQAVTGSCGDPSPLHFTGKQRDAESGLDNFGARYNASNMGRFMSPDPIHIMKQKVTDPQQWNMYAYVRNNPLLLVDNNGKWPTDIHNQIIDKAFPGLSPSQRAVLKSASRAMDGILNGGQSKGNAYQHSMRAPNESPATAKQETQDFIKTEEHLAQVDQKITQYF